MKFPFVTYVLICLGIPAGVVSAQTSGASDTATLQALLTEVRQLRIAVEKASLIAPRMQITLQRLGAQQQNVTRISQQLDEVRKQIEHETTRYAHVGQEITDLEQQLSREPDATRRKQLEDIQASRKRIIADQSTIQQLRTRENEIASSLQNERATLTELNDRLNAIDRLLASPEVQR
jgi:chromosome segregation ATPase